MTHVRALAFVPYPVGTAPSQRYRLEQWAPRLRTQGIEVEFRPFATSSLTQLLYKPGRAFRKALALSRAIISQYKQLPARGAFDVVVVHRSMALAGPPILERRVVHVAPLVYDFDDAIHLVNTSAANRAFGWLKFSEKTAEIVSLALSVTVGNDYLAGFARRHNQNVVVVPSSVDTMVYTPGPSRAPRARPVVGWMGSSTSQALMEPFAPLLARLAGAGMVVRLVSDRRPAVFGFPFEWRPWAADSEVADLRDFDVGIMPLPNTEWAKGKCAMKIIQYMGVGVPSVGSAVGANLEVIRDGENGLLASSDDEWVEKIARITRDPVTAARLGAAGRETVVTHYSAEVCADRFAEVLRLAAAHGAPAH